MSDQQSESPASAAALGRQVDWLRTALADPERAGRRPAAHRRPRPEAGTAAEQPPAAQTGAAPAAEQPAARPPSAAPATGGPPAGTPPPPAAAPETAAAAPPPEPVGVSPRDWRERGNVDFLFQGGELLVDDADVDRVSRELTDHGFAPERAHNLIDGVTLLRIAGDVEQACDVLDDAVGVGVATPNHLLHVNPGSYDLCPATDPIPVAPGTPPVPPVSRDRSAGLGVLVAVVDTGFVAGAEHRPDASWLAGVVDYDPDTEVRPGDPPRLAPYAGHGTFITGIIRCLAPAAQLRVENVFEGGGGIDEASLILQLTQALEHGPDVINLSAGCHTRKNLPAKAFVAFYERRLRHYKGTVLVAAAGNDGSRQPFWPAAFPWAVSVGALTATGAERAPYSDLGGWVDVSARGSDLVNAYCVGDYESLRTPDTVTRFDGMASWSGTSFAAPVVTGLIAARMSRTGENGRQAAAALLEGARAQYLPEVGARIFF